MSGSKTEIVQQLFKHATTGNWSEVESLLHPEFEVLPAASHPYAGVYRGVAGFQEIFRKVFFETYQKFVPKVLEFAEGPNNVVMLGSVSVTGKNTGRTIDMSLAEVFRFQDGKVRSICPHYLDTKVLVEL